jgi:hypothetical protein
MPPLGVKFAQLAIFLATPGKLSIVLRAKGSWHKKFPQCTSYVNTNLWRHIMVRLLIRLALALIDLIREIIKGSRPS